MVDEQKVDSVILRYSLLAGVADITPIIGADLAGVVGCQLKMFYDLADLYGVAVDRLVFRQLLLTLTGAVGGWGLTIFGAGEMLKLMPGVSSLLLYWQPPAIAAFTWGMGQVLKRYFPAVREGLSCDAAHMQMAMKEALKKARSLDWKHRLRESKTTAEEEVRRIAGLDNAGLPKRPIHELPYEERKMIVVVKDGTEVATAPNGLGVLITTRKAAAGELIIPVPGHPHINGLYIGHPYRPKVYYPASEFHARLCQDKAYELIDVLASLGATRVTLEEQEGYGWQAEAGAGVTGVEARGAVSKRTRSKRITQFTFAPTGAPCVPDDAVWYQWEEEWQRISHLRTRRHVSSTKLAFDYSKDFGVTGEVVVDTALLSRMFNVKVRGGYASFEKTHWDVDAEFAVFEAGEAGGNAATAAG